MDEMVDNRGEKTGQNFDIILELLTQMVTKLDQGGIL